jgi:hypothetical protein
MGKQSAADRYPQREQAEITRLHNAMYTIDRLHYAIRL